MHRVTLVAVLLTLAVIAPRAAGKRFITESDLLKFTWIADPQISPDGSTVAFVRVTVNDKENRYETSLYAVPASGGEAPRRVTSGIRDLSPRWAPDGKRIAFTRAVEKDGKPQPAQIFLLTIDGGEARPLTEISTGAGTPVWSPDGKTLAFGSQIGQEGQEGRDGQEGREQKDGYKSDVKVITRAVYRANGNPTYVDAEKHGHIFTIPADDPSAATTEKPKPKQITDGDFDERDITWSRDGASIYFGSNRGPERYSDAEDSDLHRAPAARASTGASASAGGTTPALTRPRAAPRAATPST